jgi:hypothetical protein
MRYVGCDIRVDHQKLEEFEVLIAIIGITLDVVPEKGQ